MSNLENGIEELTSVVIIFIAVLFVLVHVDHAHARTSESSQPNIVFILDGSGSMWGKVEGQHKISIAKKVLTGLIKELPDDSNVVLMVYGHRDKSDCKDIETIMTPDPLNKEFMTEKIEAISPKGMTPITESVMQAFELVRSGREPATVILLTDGLETCGGDPCAAVKAARDSGAEFVVHVVGFDVAKEDGRRGAQGQRGKGDGYRNGRRAERADVRGGRNQPENHTAPGRGVRRGDNSRRHERREGPNPDGRRYRGREDSRKDGGFQLRRPFGEGDQGRRAL